MITEIYTSQYKYNGPDRLDITVKGQDPLGKWFAPTWNMVKGLKNDSISEKEYIEQYYSILSDIPTHILQELCKRDRITLVCFCKAGTFCHRVLLAKWLEVSSWHQFIYKEEI